MMLTEGQTPTTIALSMSDSPDMAALGLSERHLREAIAEFAIHLLASGASLAYGGDLRREGFTELLFELAMRYRRQEDSQARITDYLAWPVHIHMRADDLFMHCTELQEFAQIALIGLDGNRMSMEDRQLLQSREPTEDEWSVGLTSMREFMRGETYARVVLGGRVDGYRGAMPGVAEEALLSLESGQPLFVVGGFGGCARDIAESLGLVEPWAGSRAAWPGRQSFERYGPDNLHNGLHPEGNQILARTPHIDQAVSLVLLGLRSLRGGLQRGPSQEGE